MSPLRKSHACFKFRIGKTSIPSTTAASGAFASGTNNRRRPLFFASSAIDNTPFTGRTVPSKPSSPTTQQSSALNGALPLAAIIAKAMGRSNDGPSFFKSAGARFTVFTPSSKLSAEAPMADITRCDDSRTAASGRPTMMTIGLSAPRALTSTSTSWASTPRNAAENKRVIMAGS